MIQYNPLSGGSANTGQAVRQQPAVVANAPAAPNFNSPQYQAGPAKAASPAPTPTTPQAWQGSAATPFSPISANWLQQVVQGIASMLTRGPMAGGVPVGLVGQGTIQNPPQYPNRLAAINPRANLYDLTGIGPRTPLDAPQYRPGQPALSANRAGWEAYKNVQRVNVVQKNPYSIWDAVKEQQLSQPGKSLPAFGVTAQQASTPYGYYPYNRWSSWGGGGGGGYGGYGGYDAAKNWFNSVINWNF